MKENRAKAAASVTFNGELFVTGGQNMDYSALNSTEIFKNGAWEYGPQLPVSMASHCQLTTKSGVIVSGDYYGNLSTGPYLILILILAIQFFEM